MLDTSALQPHADAIAAQQAIIDQLVVDRGRASAAARASSTHEADTAALQARRATVVGESFIAGKAADTKLIDGELRAIEKRSADAVAAEHALGLLRPRLAGEIDKLRQLRRDQLGAADELIDAAIDAERELYNQAGRTLMLQAQRIRDLTIVGTMLWRRLNGGPEPQYPSRIGALSISYVDYPDAQNPVCSGGHGFFRADADGADHLTEIKASLAAGGVELNGPVVAPPAPPPPAPRAAPVQQRHEGLVTITQNGQTHTVTNAAKPFDMTAARTDAPAPAPKPAQAPALEYPSRPVTITVGGEVQDPRVIRVGG